MQHLGRHKQSSGGRGESGVPSASIFDNNMEVTADKKGRAVYRLLALYNSLQGGWSEALSMYELTQTNLYHI